MMTNNIKLLYYWYNFKAQHASVDDIDLAAFKTICELVLPSHVKAAFRQQKNRKS